MRKIISFLIMFLLALPLVHAQELAPSIRYINVESVKSTNIVLYPGKNITCSAIDFTFALWKVPTWGDRCYYKLWVIRGIAEPELAAAWAIGFSARDPPRLQGIYEMGDVWIRVLTVMAEFPYENKTLMNPLDGVQNYYFYRIHFWFNFTLAAKDTVRFASAYSVEPTLSGSELVVFDLKQAKKDGTIPFKVKEYVSH